LHDIEALGVSADTVTKQILDSIFGPDAPGSMREAKERFSPIDIEWGPWNLSADQLAPEDQL